MSFVKKFKESLNSWGGAFSFIIEDDEYMTRPISENIERYGGTEDHKAVFLNAFLMQEMTELGIGPSSIESLLLMTDENSPIEKQLLLAVILSARENGVGKVDIVGKKPSEKTKGKFIDSRITYSNTVSGGTHNRLLIEPQKKIGKYRVDFLLTFSGVRQWEKDSNGNYTPMVKIMNTMVIECDGHDYHEKTKEQAKRDKSRDRVLQSVGYKIYHFTGSEIFQDNMKCAEQVIKDLTEFSFKDSERNINAYLDVDRQRHPNQDE